MKSILGLFTLFIFLHFQPVFSQQVISGLTINQPTSWSGTIIIEGDVVVAKNARLTIEPGTKVLFKPQMDKTNSGVDPNRSELIIEGVLKVDGKPGGKVQFSSAGKEPRMGDWYGIFLVNDKQPSVIDYAIIEFAFNGLTLKKNNSHIKNSQFQLNYNSGITCEVMANPILNTNIISENGYAGMIVSLGSRPVLSHNLISLNEIGLIIFSKAQPNLGNLAKGKEYNVGINRIFENTDYDLYNHTNTSMIAENNYWGSNRSQVASRVHGPVDYEPIYIRETNLDDLIQITQESPQLIAESSTQQQPAETARQTATQAVNRQTTGESANQPNVAQQGTLKVASNPALAINAEENTETQEKVAEPITPLKKETVTPVALTKPESERPIAALEEKPAEPQINFDQIFLEHFLDSRKGELVKQVAPKISSFGPKGRVIVRAVIDKNGNVETASVVRGLDDKSDELSLDAARQFKFKTGSVKGVPVRFFTNILFEF
jgi:TonB family protein